MGESSPFYRLLGLLMHKNYIQRQLEKNILWIPG